MAERFYGLDRGETDPSLVTEGSSSTATLDVEVRIDLAATMDRSEIVNAIETIKLAILNDIWPPA